MTQDPISGFQPLTGIFEPSAVQQLADGRFLVVEDEQQHCFSLLTLDGRGGVHTEALKPGFFDGFDSFWHLDDLEGLTMDNAGNLYAITSHSRDGDGDEQGERCKLVRFKIEGDRVVEHQVIKGLKRELIKNHAVLAKAAAKRNVKGEGGFNIEALEISADQQRLLIGFRSPMLSQRAIIASINNPAGLFDADESPRISEELINLDLGGAGIRALAHVPSLNGYLISAGPTGSDERQCQLWFWSGEASAPARQVTVDGRAGFANAEGICAALINGRQKVLVVSDDGNRAKGRPARFVLLDADQLQIAA